MSPAMEPPAPPEEAVDEVDEAPVLPEPTPGAVLAAARVRAGRSLGEMARRTRLPLAAIEAIEGDRFEELGAAVYVRGFLRLYAGEVGLDRDLPVRLLAQYEAREAAMAAQARARTEAEARSAAFGRVRALAVYGFALGAVVAAVLTAFFAFGPEPSPDSGATPDAASRGE